MARNIIKVERDPEALGFRAFRSKQHGVWDQPEITPIVNLPDVFLRGKLVGYRPDSLEFLATLQDKFAAAFGDFPFVTINAATDQPMSATGSADFQHRINTVLEEIGVYGPRADSAVA